jgi:ribosomal protein S18 acetylase RimI-like enzyme
MGTELIAMRKARAGDCEALAAIHEQAWRSTYQGLIPHLHLERMIARRGPGWWRRQLERGARLKLVAFDGVPQGYVSFGEARGPWPWPAGEIFELYLSPPFQGIGLGKRLFNAARQSLREEDLRKLVVWALEDNRMACEFYAHLGGRVGAKASEKYGAKTLQRIGFVWL